MTIDEMAIQRKLIELAELALEVLELQAKYFKSRTQLDLVKAKQKEAELRKASKAIIETKGGPNGTRETI